MKEKTKFEEMMDRLPSNIRDTDVLRYQSKKVLAALLELYLHSRARETKLVIVTNTVLRKVSGVKSNDLVPSLNQLIDHELISRTVGDREGGRASEYTIHFHNLKRPLKERTFDELFADELEEVESSGTSMGTTTTITTTITSTTTNTITTATTITTPTTTTITTPTATTDNEYKNLDTLEPIDVDNNILNNKNNLYNIDNNIILKDNILIKENNNILQKEKERKSNNSKNLEEKEGSDTEANNYSNWIDNLFLDPKDYEEDTEFIEDLEKRIAYHRWDMEDEETADSEIPF